MNLIENIKKCGEVMNQANERVNAIIDGLVTDGREEAFDAARDAANEFSRVVYAARQAGLKFQLRFGQNYEFRKVIAL